MSAAALLAEAAARGIELRAVAGGGIRYAPRGALTSELRDRLVASKPALLRHLADVAVCEASVRLASGWPGRDVAAKVCPDLVAAFDAAEVLAERAVIEGLDWPTALAAWEAAGDAINSAVEAARGVR